MNLRDQITAIAVKEIGPEFVRAVSWPTLVSELAQRAFIDKWEELSFPYALKALAVRRTWKLLHQDVGYVSPDIPGEPELDRYLK